MVNCSYCGKKISPRASVCSNCGDEIPHEIRELNIKLELASKTKPMDVISAIVGIAVAAPIFLFGLSSSSSFEWIIFVIIPVSIIVAASVALTISKIAEKIKGK